MRLAYAIRRNSKKVRRCSRQFGSTKRFLMALTVCTKNPQTLKFSHGYRYPWLIRFLLAAKCFTEESPILFALYHQHSLVPFLAAYGEDIESELTNGSHPSYQAKRSLLHLAVFKINMEQVNTLMACGADIHKKNQNGETIIQAAFSRRWFSAVVFFLKLNISICEKLSIASINYGGFTEEQEEQLLAANRNSTTGDFGRTPLHYAFAFNMISHIQTLLEKGEKVDARDWCNRTPLHVFADAPNWLYYPTDTENYEVIKIYPSNFLHKPMEVIREISDSGSKFFKSTLTPYTLTFGFGVIVYFILD